MVAPASSAASKGPSVLGASTVWDLARRCREEPIVIDGVFPELCPAIAALILERMKRQRSTASLNVGGWKSGEDFFAWGDPAVEALRRWVVEETTSPRPTAWAMVNRGGSHHPRHQHRMAILTGIYYVTTGDEAHLTPTIFETPNGELTVDPHPGRLVLLRGDTWHRVPAYPGTTPRITVAFDIRR